MTRETFRMTTPTAYPDKPLVPAPAPLTEVMMLRLDAPTRDAFEQEVLAIEAVAGVRVSRPEVLRRIIREWLAARKAK